MTEQTITRRSGDALRGLGSSFPGSDLALWAAGATFFGVIGVVPIVMVSLRLAAAVVGPAAVIAGVETAVGGLPPGHGTPQALHTLTDTAVHLSWLRTLVALFPASLYGEGLRRALQQLSPREGDWTTGWRGRFALTPLIVIGPALTLLILAAAPLVAPLYAAGGPSVLLGTASSPPVPTRCSNWPGWATRAVG